MILGAVFERFVARSPVSIMVQGALEHALHASQLDALFERHAEAQYTRTLLFSSAVDLLTQVVCGCRHSLHAAFQACEQPLGVTLTSVYNKVNGIEPPVVAALVRHSADRLGAVLRQLGGTLPAWVPGYQTRILDGNHLAATEHRLAETRDRSAGPLPGMALAVLDPEVMLVTDLYPCEDAHAQERALLGDVLARVRPRELYVADRNFCVRGFLLGLARRGAAFVIREHAHLGWHAAGKVYGRGRIDGARVREQRLTLVEDDGQRVSLRRVTLTLDEPTKDGDTVIALWTNLPEAEAHARDVGRVYRRRWTIEGAFQELATALHSEIKTLCHPRAALFAFGVGVVAYNVLGLVKGALRAVHGEGAAAEVSSYYLADEIGGTRRGLLIAIPEAEWRVFGGLSPAEFAAVLRLLAARVRLAAFRRHRRGPKKPAPPRQHDPRTPHVSTARILEQRNNRQ